MLGQFREKHAHRVGEGTDVVGGSALNDQSGTFFLVLGALERNAFSLKRIGEFLIVRGTHHHTGGGRMFDEVIGGGAGHQLPATDDNQLLCGL